MQCDKFKVIKMTISELCKKYKIPTIKKHPKQSEYNYNLSIFEIYSNIATMRECVDKGMIAEQLYYIIGDNDGWYSVNEIKEAVALHIFYNVYLEEQWEKLIPYIVHALELQLLFDY